MKKVIILFLAIGVITGTPGNAQFGKLLNKVSKSVANEITGKTTATDSQKPANTEPEPKCACEKPILVLDLGGKLKLMYSELSISVRDDGAILVKDRMTNDFYIVKDGNTQGPIKAGDPRLAGFEDLDEADAPQTDSKWENNEYITKTGEKYTIKFSGKNYGPYSLIRQFKVSRQKDKFVAEVIENMPVSEADGKKMDEAVKNAKTEQEKADLAMEYSQQMMRKMQEGGGPMSTMPKLVTNIPGVSYDPLKSVGGFLNNGIKYDEILFATGDKVIDLSNNVLVKLKPESMNAKNLFVNTPNTKYAWYNYGTLTFSDGAALSELFNPQLIKINGEVNIAYMYYSPKANSIMQCRIPF